MTRKLKAIVRWPDLHFAGELTVLARQFRQIERRSPIVFLVLGSTMDKNSPDD